MTMTMSAPRIWEFSDAEMRTARAAGWRRRDLWWERLQERANGDLANGDIKAALRGFRRASWLARTFAKNDPRRATSLANAAFTDRLSGSETRAMQRYQAAISLWAQAPSWLAEMQIRPRVRSSLFHLRMEVRHRDTFNDNMKLRLSKFAEETGAALAALSRGEPPPVRLFSRWRGEKPPVFDDTRIFLAACLLVAAPGPPKD